MARLVEQLTEQKIRAINKPGLHPDGRGLYLQIQSGGARSWIFRFTLNGRTRDMGLGPLSDISLVQARAKTAGCRALRAKGIDPIEDAKAQRGPVVHSRSSGPTFRECSEKYMEEKLSRLRSETHRHQWRYSLETFAYPIIGDMAVADVGTPDVLNVLRPIWESRCETAMRLRGRIERILARATVEGHRTSANCATWRGHLQEALPAKSEVSPVVHFRAMEVADVPAFMGELSQRIEVGAAALRFLILTVARTGEAIGARWSEIDWDKKLWTIPAIRTKTNRDHVVPLSTGAIETLQQMRLLRDIGGGFIFPGTKGRGLSQMALLKLLQRRMKRAVTTHGFRSSFRDWCGDVAEIPREIAEAALAHIVPDSTERAYRRGTAIERRRDVMQRWSNYCLQPSSGEVVDMQMVPQRSTAAA